MLIKNVMQCFGVLGCSVAMYMVSGCGAAPDAPVESDERVALGDSAGKHSRELGVSRSESGRAIGPEGTAIPQLKGGSSVAEKQAQVSVSSSANGTSTQALLACPTPSQQPGPKHCTPWFDNGCTSCLLDSACTEFNHLGHPIPGTNRKTVRGEVRGCTPSEWETYPYWQEYQNIFVDCGC